MMLKAQYQTLFDYHWQTMRRLMACAAQVDPADYFAPADYGRGSVHELLSHLLRADQGWRLGLLEGRQLAVTTDYADLAALTAGVEEEEAAWRTYLDGLTDEVIAGDVELVDRRGKVWTLALWRILQHLILHGMQHQAELAQALTAKGQPPGDLDFLFYRG